MCQFGVCVCVPIANRIGKVHEHIPGASRGRYEATETMKCSGSEVEKSGKREHLHVSASLLSDIQRRCARFRLIVIYARQSSNRAD